MHGLQKNIVSDRDGNFIGAFWKELFKLVGIDLNINTSYHPQNDGKIEKINQWIELYLRNYVTAHKKAWIKWLHLGEHYYNTTYHMSIGMSTFKALYGYEAPNFVDRIFGDNIAPK